MLHGTKNLIFWILVLFFFFLKKLPQCLNCLSATKLLWGDSLRFTTNSLEIPGTHLIELRKMTSWVDLGTTQRFELGTSGFGIQHWNHLGIKLVLMKFLTFELVFFVGDTKDTKLFNNSKCVFTMFMLPWKDIGRIVGYMTEIYSKSCLSLTKKM